MSSMRQNATRPRRHCRARRLRQLLRDRSGGVAAPPGLVQSLDGGCCLGTSKLDTVVESSMRLYGSRYRTRSSACGGCSSERGSRTATSSCSAVATRWPFSRSGSPGPRCPRCAFGMAVGCRARSRSPRRLRSSSRRHLFTRASLQLVLLYPGGRALGRGGPATGATAPDPLGPSTPSGSAPLVRRCREPLPAPALMGILLTPVVPVFVRQAGASDERVQRDLAELPGLLDRVDSLLEGGVIGGEEFGAADFQIGSSVRVLIAMQDVSRLVAGRPAESFARRVVPDSPEVPAALPADSLPTVGSISSDCGGALLSDTACNSPDQGATYFCADRLIPRLSKRGSRPAPAWPSQLVISRYRSGEGQQTAAGCALSTRRAFERHRAPGSRVPFQLQKIDSIR